MGVARRWLPGLLPLVVAVWLLLASGVPARDVAVYAAYLVLGVLGPGVLVSRAVLGPSPLLVAELGTGGVAGLVLTLPAWALTTVLGRGDLLRWWPLVVYAVFLLVPALRRHWRVQRYPERLGPLVAWTVAASVAGAWLPLRETFLRTLPLTGATQWPADMHWHLALVELFARQVSPQEPQVAGTHLAYHWFANADVAAASLATGLDPAEVLTRLWVLPVVALTFAALVAALREVGPGAVRGAGLASLIVAAPAGLEVFQWFDVPWDPVFAPYSPSQNYCYPFLLVTVALVVRWLKHGRRWDLVPLGVLLVAGPGVKASMLPVLLSGLLLATVVALLRRAAWRRPALLTVMTALALVVGTLAIGAGGATGAGVRLWSTLSRLPVYYESLGVQPGQGSAFPPGWLPPGLDRPGMPSVLVLLFLAVVVKYAWVLPGLPLLRRREGLEAAPWVLFGGGLAGWLLMDLVDQAGVSQVYFMGAGTVLWAMLAGWGTVVLLDRARARHGRRATARWAAVGAVVGCVLVLAVAALAAVVAHRVLPPADPVPPFDLPTPAETATALRAGVVPLVLLLALAAGYVLVRRGRRPGTVLRAVAVVAAVLSASLVLNPYLSGPNGRVPPLSRWAVSPAELEAARWVADHAGPHDVVATNVHCLTPRAGGLCDARAFWVSSLTRRRTFLGGWAYLDEVRALGTRGGLSPLLQPFPDRARFAVNEALFTSPTPAVAEALAGQGVRWVYADRRRTRVSPHLAAVADLVFSNAEVDVYRLPPVGQSADAGSRRPPSAWVSPARS